MLVGGKAIFAGPYPDDNMTLAKAREYQARLALLFPNNLATILMIGPGNLDSYNGSYQLLDTVYSEQDMLDAGVDPDIDPVWVRYKFANVAKNPSFGRGVGFDLDRGNFTHVAMSIFGIDVNVQMAQLQAELGLARNPATQNKTLVQVMQGK